MYYIFQTFLETFTPSYRLQNEHVGHLQALPGGLRVPNAIQKRERESVCVKKGGVGSCEIITKERDGERAEL